MRVRCSDPWRRGPPHQRLFTFPIPVFLVTLTSFLLCLFFSLQADNIQHITKAANVRVQPFWPAVFARTLGNADITEMILHAGAAPAAGEAAPAGEEKKEEKKEEKEEEEEEEGDFGLDLFA